MLTTETFSVIIFTTSSYRTVQQVARAKREKPEAKLRLPLKNAEPSVIAGPLNSRAADQYESKTAFKGSGAIEPVGT
jgi:hypothetical protein